MDSLTLGLLIIGSISAIGFLQLIVWTVVVIRNPSLDFLRLESADVGHSDTTLRQRRQVPGAATVVKN